MNKGQFQVGTVPWNKGKSPTIETKLKMREAKLGKRGAETNNFICGEALSSQGYVLIRVDGVYVEKHRHIMELYLGRKLLSEEVVHHKDGNKTNNDFANLELLLNQSSHSKLHPRDCFGKFKAGGE
jgi:hypothetical protein